MKVQQFTSSFSKGMLWSTVFVSLIILAALIIAISSFVNTNSGKAAWYFDLFVILILVGSYLYAFMNQVKGLIITNDAVVIKKMIGSVTIPFDSIVRAYSKRSIKNDIRLFGISGLYGHLGLFSNNATGKYYAYAKDGCNLIAIETKSDNYVVSCDNAKDVVAILQKVHV